MEEQFKLPSSLLQDFATYTKQQGLTPDEFVTLSVAEKLARLEHEEWSKANSRRRGPQPAEPANNDK